VNASRRHDAVVVGSGFGGAVLACRLAEADRSVLVLERGREWAVDDYPSVSGTNWIWSAERPERENGWIDLRAFRNVAVVQGAGVGGGSLAYANVSIEAEATAFAGGWPVGTTEILLRSRDVFGTLGRLSECLGRGWSANGDFLSLAFYPTRSISATRGPTATAAISFLDGSIGDQSFFVEDGGFPDLVGQALQEMGRGHPRLCSLFPPLGKATGSRTPLQSIMPWLGQGMDASNDTLLLARRKAPAGGRLEARSGLASRVVPPERGRAGRGAPQADQGNRGNARRAAELVRCEIRHLASSAQRSAHGRLRRRRRGRPVG